MTDVALLRKPGPISNEEIQAKAKAFRDKIMEEAERERKIIEKFGFSVHAHQNYAFTKGLKIDDKPVILFSHCSLATGDKLASILGLLAAEAQQTKIFSKNPTLPFGVAVDPEKPEEITQLRIETWEAPVSELNAFTSARNIPISVPDDFTVIGVRIGDRNNLLPGEDGYTDVHQF